MEYPLQISFRNIRPSLTIEEWIREEARKLDTFYDDVMRCRVAIEMPHRHHKKGRLFHVRIDLSVPGEEIVVKREPSLSSCARQSGDAQLRKHLELKTPRKDVRQAINDAFKAAGRRLQDYARRHRGDIKTHTLTQIGRITEIVSDKSHGFLTSEDGRRIYFHRNSVLRHGFARLKVGTTVRFVEEPGDKGPQASTVSIAGKKRVLSPVVSTAA